MFFKALIFDLDGTLVDTLADLSDAMNWSLSELSEPVHRLEACRAMIGNGVSMFAKRALSPDKQHLCPRLLELLKARYSQKCFEKSFVFDGVGAVVVKLRQNAIRLAVATNKDEDDAVRIVEHFFGVGTFEVICGVRSGGPVKPDAAFAGEIMARMGLVSDDFAFVGDSDVDVATAKAVGMRCIGVTWGFRSVEQLKAAGADIIIDRPEEILDLPG